MANRNYGNFFNTIGEENDIFEQFGSSNNPSYLPTDSSTHDFSSFTIPNLDSPNIKNRHNNAQVDIRTQMNLGGGTSGNLSTWQYDESRARQELVDFMVRAEQPFTFVKKHDFIGTIKRSLNPQFKVFSTSTARRDSLKGFQK